MRKVSLLSLLAFLNCALFAQTPQAYYPFNGNSLDSTGNAHHGTVNGAVLTTDRFGNLNSAYFFDGIDDFINLANPATLQGNSYTFELWVKPATNPSGTAQCALSIGGNGGDQIITNVSAGADVGWNLSGYQLPSGTYDLVSGTSPTVNQWYHIVGVRDQTVARLYVNGIQVDTAVYSAATSPNYGQNFANIGRRTFNQFQYFHGAIDDVKIFNQALSPTQVLNLFQPSNALVFAQAAATDAILVPASPLTGMTGDFTLSMKAYFTDINHWNMLFINNSGSGGAEFSYTGSGSNNPYTLQFSTDGSSGNVTFAKSWIPQPNKWYSIAFTRKGNVYKGYVDGILLDSAISNAPFPNYSAQGLRIGNYFTGFSLYNFQGRMDDVSYWNTALTSSYISDSLKNNLFASNASGLVLNYNMDTIGFGAGLNVKNHAVLGGSALNGTTLGSATTPYFSPAPTNLSSPYRSCWEILQATPASPNGNYWIDPDGPGGSDAFECSCDMTTDGGGWTLVSNYNHLAATNPALLYRSSNLPLLGSSTLGVDESGGIYWGNASNALMNKIPFDTLRWYGTSGQAGKVTHFKSGHPSAWSMAKSGTGDYSVLSTSKILYPDNTSVNVNCIGSSGNLFNNWSNLLQCFGVDIWSVGISGSGACTPFPGWPNLWQWSIDASYCDNNHPNSLHRIWVKGPNPCNLFSAAPLANVLGSSSLCVDGNWKHIYNPANPSQIIASVDDNELNLGTLSGSVYLEAGATGTYNGQHFLKRHYVVNAQNNPAGAKRVRLYMTSAELSDLLNADPMANSISDLKVTKYSGPTADGVFNPADAISIQVIPSASIVTGMQYGLPYLEFDVNGFSEFWIHGGHTAPLPVNIQSFTGVVCGHRSCLNWKTMNEENVQQYEIERSADGRTFEVLGSVQSAGNSLEGQTYSYTDAAPLYGRNYYRLKSVDLDGQFANSQTVSLNHSDVAEVSVVPTVSVDGHYVIHSLLPVNYYEVFSLAGQKLMKVAASAEIDLSAKPKGVYFVRMSIGEEVTTQRIIKQ